MKKPKTMEFNLATLTPEKLVNMLEKNQAQMGELIALLEALFDMFSSSLKFSNVVIEYGEARHNHFLEKFVEVTAEQHGVNPKELIQSIEALRKRANPSASIH